MIWIVLIIAAVVLMSMKSDTVVPPLSTATTPDLPNTTIYKTASAIATPKSVQPGNIPIATNKNSTPIETATSDDIISTTIRRTATATNTLKDPTVDVTGDVRGYQIAKVVPSTQSPIAPTTLLRVPPPGYAGPINGPFSWVGVGPAPDGKDTVIGNVVNVAPDGYGYDMSKNVYQWVGQGLPPNGNWQLPFNVS
jgi:hypothetical protein